MNGQVNPRLVMAFERDIRAHGCVNADDARELVRIAEQLNAESSGCCSVGNKGFKHLRRLLDNAGDRFDDRALAIVNGWGLTGRTPPIMIPVTPDDHNPLDPNSPVEGPGRINDPARVLGKVILDYQAEKKTHHVHWYPQTATRPGGDPINNLYARGGILAKYGAIFGGDARGYELDHAAVLNADPTKAWWGKCDKASQVSCILPPPAHEATLNGVTCSPEEIKGMLVCVVDSLVGEIDFIGHRYNGEDDDPEDPRPSVFLDGLKEWKTNNGGPAIPFNADLDRNGPVWNYAYDGVKVYESDVVPPGFNTSTLPHGGKIKYYHAKLTSTGYPDQARDYQFWIQYDNAGEVKKDGWIQGQDPKISPDFLWRPHPAGDLRDPATWVTKPRKQSNPRILAENVFKLYQLSMA